MNHFGQGFSVVGGNSRLLPDISCIAGGTIPFDLHVRMDEENKDEWPFVFHVPKREGNYGGGSADTTVFDIAVRHCGNRTQMPTRRTIHCSGRQYGRVLMKRSTEMSASFEHTKHLRQAGVHHRRERHQDFFGGLRIT